MKNFKITAKEDGKEYWISRAHAVVGIVYTVFEGNYLFLVSKRGSGCPDHVGKWSITCGYLDWGETRKDAVKRELYEELGLDLSNYENTWILHFCTIDDPKRDARENIVSRYIVPVDYNILKTRIDNKEININTTSRGGEPNEVDEIKIISSKDIDNYDWAFNHGQVLKEVLEYFKTGQKPNYCNEY